jgi:hypothetical protein
MMKKLLITAVLLSLVGVLGCTSAATTKTPASVKSIREAEISAVWTMEQMEISLKSEVTIILNLADGDKVDGYFYVEAGDNIRFTISGGSLIYQSEVTAQGTQSDRFSFTASAAQGIAYTLKFTPMIAGAQQTSDSTIFLEIIYPVTGGIYVPFGTK